MDEKFELPVIYNGKQLLFPAKLIRIGYTYKIEVDVHGTPIFFEPDEERNWRAIMHSETSTLKEPDQAVLQSIVDAIETITK